MKTALLALSFVCLGSSLAYGSAAECYQRVQTAFETCRQSCGTQSRCLTRCFYTRRQRLQQCPGNPSQTERAVLDLVNQQRTSAGLSALIWDIRLGEAAQAHAANMAAQGQAVHVLDGRTNADRLRAAGYAFSQEAENLYWGQGSGHDTPQAAVNWWLNSPGHRANMLSATLTYTGIGVRQARDGKWYFGQSFARP